MSNTEYMCVRRANERIASRKSVTRHWLSIVEVLKREHGYEVVGYRVESTSGGPMNELIQGRE